MSYINLSSQYFFICWLTPLSQNTYSISSNAYVCQWKCIETLTKLASATFLESEIQGTIYQSSRFPSVVMVTWTYMRLCMLETPWGSVFRGIWLLSPGDADTVGVVSPEFGVMNKKGLFFLNQLERWHRVIQTSKIFGLKILWAIINTLRPR